MEGSARDFSQKQKRFKFFLQNQKENPCSMPRKVVKVVKSCKTHGLLKCHFLEKKWETGKIIVR